MNAPVDPLIRVSKVATICDCSKTTVYAMLRDGTLPSLRIGKSLRVPSADLQRWIEDQKTHGARDQTAVVATAN
jgi:excisionase family DNA binding protein